MSSGSVNVDGHQVWYERFGTGSHPILLIPGAIGTGRTDFWQQIQGSNALNLKRYTLIAMEPLGWGRSRPPVRTYDSQLYNMDAFCGNKIMEVLGFTTYSVMGWSDGAKTALIMAFQYISRIRSCIIWGIVTNVTEKDIKAVIITKNTKFLGNECIERYEKVYGNQWTELWTKHIDFLENIINIFPKGITKLDMKKVLCSVLVLHGDQDPIVDKEHALYVTETIAGAELHRFPKGSHNLHFTFATDFKKIVENFLQEVDDEY